MVMRAPAGSTTAACRRLHRDRCGRPESRRAVCGFALIEVMVTAVLLAVGRLVLAGLQARAAVAEMEAYQRTQALLLAQDMAERLLANKAEAPRYVGTGYGGDAAPACTAPGGYALDLCRWGNALRGAAERSGPDAVGTLVAGLGCIAATGPREYRIVVAWQGLVPTATAGPRCDQGDHADPVRRRAVAVQVHLPVLGGV